MILGALPLQSGSGPPVSRRAALSRIVCVKFCKWRSFRVGLGGLAELGFLMLLEIVHVEVSVGIEPVLVGFDGEGLDEAAAGV